MERIEFTPEYFATCPIRNIVSRFGDKWSLLVLLTISGAGVMRYNEIEKSIPDISSRVLSGTLKTLEQDSDLEIMNGRYGPYSEYKGKNYRLPKARHEKAAEMTYEECMEIVNSQPATKPSRRKK